MLVVEDDDALRESLAETLSDEGYAVATARNGADALSWLRSNAAPCLILLDLWMPVMTGEQFRVVQLADPVLAPIPVVVVSAMSDGASLARKLNAQGFIEKPIGLDKLVAMVEANC